MSMSTILVDDEQNNLDNLSLLLKEHCPTVNIVATARNAEEGKQAILQHHPDLLFLDIQMPGGTGFDLLRSLSNYDFEVIFVTAYDHYAIQAVKFAAVDYLLKPISVEELKGAVEKAAAKSRQKKQNLQIENLIQLLQQQSNKQEHRIALNTLKETRFVPTQQIMYCASSNNYSTFHLADGEKLLVSRPIHEFEELLKDYGFIRCHQSRLVNMSYIKSWVKEDGGYLLLDNGEQVPVSKNKRDSIKEALGQNRKGRL